MKNFRVTERQHRIEKAKHMIGFRAVTPNPSLNHRTRYGMPSWPGLGYAVHFPSPGQAVLPQRSG